MTELRLARDRGHANHRKTFADRLSDSDLTCGVSLRMAAASAAEMNRRLLALVGRMRQM